MTTLNLQPFCSTWNPKMMTPWSRGDYTFATDGRIIVRVPRIEEIPDRIDAPGALKLWEKVSISGRPIEIPITPEATYHICGDCEGRGRTEGIVCDECDGTGKILDFANSPVGGMVYADRYLDLVRALPGYKFYPVQWDFSQGSNAPPSPFTFDGGDGLLMPAKT